RHDILPIFDHRFGIGSEGVAAVDAGIVDQDRDLADLGADLLGNLTALVALGHVEHEADGLAAGPRNGPDGLGRRDAVGVEEDDLCSLLRVAARDRPPDSRTSTGNRRDVSFEKPRHFPSPFLWTVTATDISRALAEWADRQNRSATVRIRGV